MAEDTNAQATQGEGNGEGKNGVQFMLQRIYLKDLSFESPLGVEAFTKNWQPKINQDLNTNVNKIDEEHFEVVLKLTVNATIDDKTVFLVEVQQAGLFLIKNVEGQQLAQIFNTMCPQILFPYAREVVDNCAIKGSFPALALPPVNFDALFIRAMQQSKAAQAQKDADQPVTN